ncbi:MAG: DNA repair protein RecN [Pseudomonadota bacterium]
MLTALSIFDFVLIRHLSLDAGSGFTGLTGETGAGKSIILDAIGMVLGMRPAKRFVRAGAEKAVICAEFDVPAGHPVWAVLDGFGIVADASEALILKRLIPARGGARGFVNGQPVTGSMLAEIGDHLVEVHGQHAASNLLKPSYHRDILDRFAGNDRLLATYRSKWSDLLAARTAHQDIVAETEALRVAAADLRAALQDLEDLGLVPGEADKLTADRAECLQAERIGGTVREALSTLQGTEADAAIAAAAGALRRLVVSPGIQAAAGSMLFDTLQGATDSFERASIETQEAVGALERLSVLAMGDDRALEAVEARLFALKAAARRHRTDPDGLIDVRDQLRAQVGQIDAGDARVEAARQRETEAAARWRHAAEMLSRSRRAAGKRLQAAAQKELQALHLGRAKMRFSIVPLEDSDADSKGTDLVEIEVETNPGGGFGPLRTIASGGELARFSLALKCAAAEAEGGVATVIFDEADQGVGGAVAAAIGERLTRLGEARQVFAVTHSPQVAAAASIQWRIEKHTSGKSLGQMRATVLDAEARLEEIARMLAGRRVTPEARAAAERLLEG